MIRWVRSFSKAEWYWALFDWANSAYATTVMAGFFPILFKNEFARSLPSTDSTFWLGATVSISSLIVAVSNPFLGFLTDRLQCKKMATLLSSLVAWISVVGLAFIGPDQWSMALWLFGFSLAGFNLGMSFYDSLLKHVTVSGKEHLVSSLGYGLGYLGGGVLLSLNIFMVFYASWFGWEGPIEAMKYSFVTVVIWWIVFSFPFFRWVVEKKQKHIIPSFRGKMIQVFYEFNESLKVMIRDKNILLFLVSYWLYIDVVYTVINMATDYGSSLGLGPSQLVSALLLVQLVAFPATLIVGRLTLFIATRYLLLILLFVYVIIIFWGYRLQTAFDFWGLAVFIALAQGGVQSLSRSLFAQLIPLERSGEWFGVFNLVGRFASILGPLVMGGVTRLSGDHRVGLLALWGPLLLGMALLFLVKPTRQVRD
ncbi:MAG: MFS transporter [Bdellovibrionaceae bacterium]|nr:MFS transporter [Pseudobdellovibrionaceae bacterium]MDW8190406.1 MFS transporter [Pseudobdellovibrionaceae bacterium]